MISVIRFLSLFGAGWTWVDVFQGHDVSIFPAIVFTVIAVCVIIDDYNEGRIG